MAYTKTQYENLLLEDSDELESLNKVTGRYEFITATFPSLGIVGMTSLVNAISLERAISAFSKAVTAALDDLPGGGP